MQGTIGTIQYHPYRIGQYSQYALWRRDGVETIEEDAQTYNIFTRFYPRSAGSYPG